MRPDQHGRHLQRIGDPGADRLDDDVAGLGLVGALDLGIGHLTRDGHRSAEVVRVRRPQAGDVASGLCERGGERGVRVDDPADPGEGLVETQMGGRVARRAQVALEDAAILERDSDEVLWPHLIAGDAAGLDDEGASRAVQAAGIPEGQRHQAGLHEIVIGLADLLTKGLIDHRRDDSGLTGSIRLHTLDCGPPAR